jgi:hypothetical protein
MRVHTAEQCENGNALTSKRNVNFLLAATVQPNCSDNVRCPTVIITVYYMNTTYVQCRKQLISSQLMWMRRRNRSDLP